ncbi:hypothetical protein GW17_00009712 [Ensete ventricosum]|nr:hypothetical protein GW17_00009712 [Ensete ventricosum]
MSIGVLPEACADPFDKAASGFPSGFDGYFPNKMSPPFDSIEYRVPTEDIQDVVLPFYVTQPNLSIASMAHTFEPAVACRCPSELSVIDHHPQMEVEMNRKPMSARRNGGKAQKKTNVVVDKTSGTVWTEKVVSHCSDVTWKNRKAVQREMAQPSEA